MKRFISLVQCFSWRLAQALKLSLPQESQLSRLAFRKLRPSHFQPPPARPPSQWPHSPRRALPMAHRRLFVKLPRILIWLGQAHSHVQADRSAHAIRRGP